MEENLEKMREFCKPAGFMNISHDMESAGNEVITAKEKKRDLYLRQKELLDTFLEHGAISQAQHDKSLGDLTEKMGMQPSSQPND